MRKTLIASSALWVGHCPAKRWKTCLRSAVVWRAETVVTASRYDYTLNNLDSVIDKILNWCNVKHLLLGDWCYHWLDANCVRRRFVTKSFFLVDGCAYSWSFCEFFCVVIVNIFSPVNKMLLTSFGNILSANVLTGRVLHGSSLHSALGNCDSWAQTFHKVV